MTSAEYRELAERAMRPQAGHPCPTPERVAEAAVWAQLATAAAIEGQGAARADADRPASVQIAEAAVRAAATEEAN